MEEGGSMALLGKFEDLIPWAETTDFLVAIPRKPKDPTVPNLATDEWFIVCPCLHSMATPVLQLEEHYQAVRELADVAEVWGYNIGMINKDPSYYQGMVTNAAKIMDRVAYEVKQYHSYRTDPSYWNSVLPRVRKLILFYSVENKKIQAIKAVRAACVHPGGIPMGLKDAKDLVEREWPR
jgi:hypothetical protein